MSGQLWDEHAKVLINVIDAWSSYSAGYPSDETDEADFYRLKFRPLDVHSVSKALSRAKARRGDTAWEYLSQYLYAMPIRVGSPELYPVVQFVVRKGEGHLDLSVRVATYYLATGLKRTGTNKETIGPLVMADGWRFEMADIGSGGGDGFHHFPHVQRTTSWDEGKTTPSLGFHAPQEFDPTNHPALNSISRNESRPAFPLPASTPAGVVVSTMASLYGANLTSKILLNYEGKPLPFVEEMKRILAVEI